MKSICSTLSVHFSSWLGCLAVLSCLLLGYSSCSTEFEVNAPFEELPIVWTFLDATDSIHYVRIQRSFPSSDSGAFGPAMDPDLIYYPPGAIEVYVEEYFEDFVLNRWPLERVLAESLGIIKDEGVFASDPNVLYRFEATISEEYQYRLEINQPDSMRSYEAETEIVEDFNVLFPLEPEIALDFSDTGLYKMQWVSADNAYIYDAYYEIQYTEFNAGGDSIAKSVLIPAFRNFTDPNPNGPVVLTEDVQNLSFFFAARNALDEPDPGSYRVFRQMDLRFVAGGFHLYQLYRNSLATIGLQELFITTAYSNLEGGLGVFSSTREELVVGLSITPSSVDSLACGRFTNHLGFRRANGEECP